MTYRSPRVPDRVEQVAREAAGNARGEGPGGERDAEARARALLAPIALGRGSLAAAARAVAARAAGDEDASGLLDKLGLTADLGLDGKVPALRAAVATAAEAAK